MLKCGLPVNATPYSLPPNTACFRPFFCGTFCDFIVNPQTSLCKLSRVCPTFCAKTLGYIMHSAQIRANFAQNQPSKRLLRKTREKSHLTTLGRTPSVAQRLRGYKWRSEKSVKAIAPTGAALAFLCFDFFFRIVKGVQPLARCGVGGVQR